MILYSIISWAMCREHSSWTGWSRGSKFALWSHTTVDVLYDTAKQHAITGMRPSMYSSHIVIILAIYLSTLLMCHERNIKMKITMI